MKGKNIEEALEYFAISHLMRNFASHNEPLVWGEIKDHYRIIIMAMINTFMIMFAEYKQISTL